MSKSSLSVFVRRCHYCGDTTESNDDFVKCSSCTKTLLPFYYFDKKAVADYADNQVRPEYRDGTTGYGPIRGLTAVW